MSRVSRYTANPKYPVTKSLSELFGAQKEKFVRKTRLRVGERFGSDVRNEIVSERLCDDTIKYLAPTLEQHKGCTIIDINPGACLWSRKLHEYLRPRRHLLMEPDDEYVETFIKPLLETPGSTYRHTTLAGAHPVEYWENFRKVFSNAELAPRQVLPEDDPARRQLDPSFLVIGNLARQISYARRTKSVAFGSLILQQAAQAALANELYHNEGLVRMLWWVPETEKPTLFPTSESFRHGFNAKVSFASTVSEVVGCGDLYNHAIVHVSKRRHRAEELVAFTAERVRQSMQASGMQAPEGREFIYDRPAYDPQSVVSPLETSVSTPDDLRREVAAAQNRWLKLEEFLPKPGAVFRHPKKLLQDDPTETLEFPQCLPAAKTFTPSARAKALAVYSDMGLTILRLEVGLKVLEEKTFDPQQLQKLRILIIELHERWMDNVSSRSDQFAEWVTQLIDEEQAVFQNPPLLALDSRTCEPLKADSTEFWPENELMLLDMMPKSRDLSVPDLADNAEGMKIFQMLLRNLLSSRRSTLAAALNKIAPNAAQDLLPMVPAATDPRKGGRLDAGNMRCRMLSEAVMEGLVTAWVEWPFKPSTTQLELASESVEEVPEDQADAPIG